MEYVIKHEKQNFSAMYWGSGDIVRKTDIFWRTSKWGELQENGMAEHESFVNVRNWLQRCYMPTEQAFSGRSESQLSTRLNTALAWHQLSLLTVLSWVVLWDFHFYIKDKVERVKMILHRETWAPSFQAQNLFLKLRFIYFIWHPVVDTPEENIRSNYR